MLNGCWRRRKDIPHNTRRSRFVSLLPVLQRRLHDDDGRRRRGQLCLKSGSLRNDVPEITRCVVGSDTGVRDWRAEETLGIEQVDGGFQGGEGSGGVGLQSLCKELFLLFLAELLSKRVRQGKGLQETIRGGNLRIRQGTYE